MSSPPESTPPTKRPRAYSKGEELYLVHLSRMSAPDPHPEDAEDDHDVEETPRRKPKKTIGEELYEVHLKRSQGLEPDYDVPISNKKDAKLPSKAIAAKSSGGKHYDLRTRKV